MVITLAMVLFLKNGLIRKMHALNMGPIFTTWMVHSLIGRLSSFAAPTLQFFGESHFKIVELSPVQSAINEIPFICVIGSLKSTCIQISSINDESLNSVVGKTFPMIGKFEINKDINLPFTFYWIKMNEKKTITK